MSRTAAGGGPDPRGSGSPAAAISPFRGTGGNRGPACRTAPRCGRSQPRRAGRARLAPRTSRLRCLRPVAARLCSGPCSVSHRPTTPPCPPGSGGALPTCGAPYQLKASAIDVTLPITDIRRIRVRPIPHWRATRAAPVMHPNQTVLLGGQRPDSLGREKYWGHLNSNCPQPMSDRSSRRRIGREFGT